MVKIKWSQGLSKITDIIYARIEQDNPDFDV
jgi:hypothetical protein